MSVKLLTEHHLGFLSLKLGCTGWYESTLVKIPHCWESHVMAQLSLSDIAIDVRSHLSVIITYIKSLPSGLFCMLFGFQNLIFEKFFKEYHQSVKQIGSGSGPTFCWA